MQHPTLNSREHLLLTDGAVAGKTVVFSQFATVIKHVEAVLKSIEVPHVKIAQGDNLEMLRSAVATFNSDESCGVFLLHAGTAAAGLTLTAARYVILMEPFLAAAVTLCKPRPPCMYPACQQLALEKSPTGSL